MVARLHSKALLTSSIPAGTGEGKAMNPYQYKAWNGKVISLESLLDHSYSKEEVARLAGVEHRRQRLIAAIEALYKAGELEVISEVLETRYNVKTSC
jgi:hypothetical protein